MALRTKVKLNSISNLHDARYGAGMSVDLLGIAWNPNSLYVTQPGRLEEMAKWIVGTDFVAEIDSHLLPIPAQYQTLFSYVQTSHETQVEKIASQYQLPIILQKEVLLPANCEYLAEIPLGDVEMIILKADAPTWTAAWARSVTNLSLIIPTLLDFGYEATLIAQITREVPTVGFALDGSTEIKTGINDMDKLTQILEILELP